MLRRLTLRNLLSFGPQTAPLELGPLNVLIGPNGSGKTNFLEALAVLQAAPREIAGPVREGGGVLEWLWKGADREPQGLIEAVIDSSWSTPLRYQLMLGAKGPHFAIAQEVLEEAADPQRRYLVHDAREAWIHSSQDGAQVIGTSDPRDEPNELRFYPGEDRSVLAVVRDAEEHEPIVAAAEAMASIRIYRDWTFGRRASVRLPQPADQPQRYLAADGQNLSLVLNQIRRNAAAKRALLSHLREAYEGIDDIEIIIEGGTVQLALQEGSYLIPASRLSEGTLRWLCLLAVLLHPTAPRVVCLEEPEVGLHPDLLPRLARLLRDASSRMQVIVTTHSDVLVDALNETPEAIIVCEKRDGATTLSRPDRGQLEQWLKEYSLGQLWRSGELGGNRW